MIDESVAARSGTLNDPGAPALEVRDVWARFSSDAESWPVLRDVSLEAERGGLIVVIGPSGCGKSTLFNIIAGLLQPTSGEILLHGHHAQQRLGRVGYMPQKDLLLPWKRVLDNTALGLEIAGMPRREARAEARRWFPAFGLEGYESYYPSALSGGMRQRTALLRTFLGGRDLLLLDEPFGALDALTRLEMQGWLLDVWSAFQKTILLVTHDIEEAIYLADRVYVMSPRPGTIRSVVEVDLPRPRVYGELIASQAFAGLKRELFEALQEPGEASR